MSLPLKESNAARALASALVDFLPGGGARIWSGHVNFGTVAQKAGVGAYWASQGSKTPRLAELFEKTIQFQRDRFEPLILGIVREGLTYCRKNGKSITKKEIDHINGLILEIGFQFPDLWDKDFRDALDIDDTARAKSHVDAATREHEVRVTERQQQIRELGNLQTEFVALTCLENRQEAGRRLETLLNRLFELSDLKPRAPFRVEGEQIDGSFLLDGEVYLVEAKWEKNALGQAELLVFRGKIESKSAFTRGVFIALNDVTEPARDAITRGKQPNFFIMNGYDLMMILQGAIPLAEFLRRRQRLLAEEGAVAALFDRVR